MASKLPNQAKQTNTLLIVVSDEEQGLGVSEFLEEEGFSTALKLNSTSAFEWLEKYIPLAILVDENSVEQGIEHWTKSIRLLPQCGHTPLFLLARSLEWVAPVVSQGNADFCLFPWNYDELLLRLQILFGNKEMFLELQERNNNLAAMHVSFDLVNQILDQTQHKLQNDSPWDIETGLYNQQHLQHTLEREWGRCRRSHVPLSLITSHWTNFNKIQEELGRLKVEILLKKFANTLKFCARRSSDCWAYLGQGKFAVLLADTNESGAETVRKIIESRMSEINVNEQASFEFQHYSEIPESDFGQCSFRDAVKTP